MHIPHKCVVFCNLGNSLELKHIRTRESRPDNKIILPRHESELPRLSAFVFSITQVTANLFF